jgi:hypothetical protein
MSKILLEPVMIFSNDHGTTLAPVLGIDSQWNYRLRSPISNLIIHSSIGLGFGSLQVRVQAVRHFVWLLLLH